MGAAGLMIAAPASGQGKSILTAALARLHRRAGREVRVLKHGPDYLDPMLQERASGAPVYQLHPWMTGEAECRWRVRRAARTADVLLVEGAMGLFDGNPSSADLAALLGMPVAIVVDARAMAETFGAVVSGLARYRRDIPIAGVIANRVGSAGHGRLLCGSLPEGVAWLGGIPRDDALALPGRHLGLVQAAEVPDLEARLDGAAAVLEEAGIDAGLGGAIAAGPAQEEVGEDGQPAAGGCLSAPGEAEAVAAAPGHERLPGTPPGLLEGCRIAVARDAAFGFIYRANLELLEAMGGEVVFFSPLADPGLPGADAVWLPGGYPELHAAQLEANIGMWESIRSHHAAGGSILAECGGLMHAMLGLLPARAEMASDLKGLGMQAWAHPAGELRGHTFHHSRLATELEPVAWTRRRGGSAAEAIYQVGSLTATYFHAYFPSAPHAVASLLAGSPVAGGIERLGSPGPS